MRPQELPRRPGHVVFPVEADVAAPHHPRARPRQRRGQPSGLRVVQQHHIARLNQGEQFHRIRGQQLRVVIGVRRAEGATPEMAMDLVVQALGEREKLGVPGDHQPADRDVQILDVPDQDLQHLGDPAACRGRVDVPDGVPGQRGPELVSAPGHFPVSLGADDGLQHGHRPPGYLHGLQQAHDIRLPLARGRAVNRGATWPLIEALRACYIPVNREDKPSNRRAAGPLDRPGTATATGVGAGRRRQARRPGRGPGRRRPERHQGRR